NTSAPMLMISRDGNRMAVLSEGLLDGWNVKQLIHPQRYRAGMSQGRMTHAKNMDSGPPRQRYRMQAHAALRATRRRAARLQATGSKTPCRGPSVWIASPPIQRISGKGCP